MYNRTIFLFTSFFIICFIALLAFNPGNIKTRISSNGNFIFTSNDLKNNSIYKLKGNWSFYKDKTIEDISLYYNTPTLVTVPQSWVNYDKTKNTSPYGYGIFQTKITIPDGDTIEHLGIKTGRIGTAYSVYINGVKEFSAGTPTTKKATTIPQYHPSVISFDEKSSEYTITIFVANFHDRTGGIWEDIYFGNYEDLVNFREKINNIDLFFAGGLFIFSIYHIGLFLLRRKDSSPLYFAIFCFLITVRVFIIRESVFENTYGYLSWEMGRKIEYLTYYLGTLVFFMFVRSLFTDLFHKYTLYLAITLVSIASLPVLFTEAAFYSSFLSLTHISSLIVLLIPLYYVAIAVKQRLPYSRIILYGLLILFTATINDILNAEQIIFTGNTIHIALFLFIFIQSFILAEKFSQAFILSEELLGDNMVMYQQVKEMNEELESKINSRTKDLREQLISKSRFVSIITHDMKGPLGSTILYIDFLYSSVEDSINDSAKKMFQILKTSVTGMHSMLNNILATEIIKNASLPSSNQNLSINQTVIEILNIFEGMIKQKNLRTAVDADSEYYTSSDSNTIQTILRNLISNAIKYTSSEGTISIFIRNFNQDNIEIVVKDTGVGMTQKEIETVFSVEKKFSKIGTNGEKGTGYGLMLTKDLVDSINGEIWLTSELNIGSSFHFTVKKK